MPNSSQPKAELLKLAKELVEEQAHSLGFYATVKPLKQNMTKSHWALTKAKIILLKGYPFALFATIYINFEDIKTQDKLREVIDHEIKHIKEVIDACAGKVGRQAIKEAISRFVRHKMEITELSNYRASRLERKAEYNGSP